MSSTTYTLRPTFERVMIPEWELRMSDYMKENSITVWEPIFFHFAVMKCLQQSYRPVDTTGILWDLVQEAKNLNAEECLKELNFTARLYFNNKDDMTFDQRVHYVVRGLFSKQFLLNHIQIMINEKHDIESYKYSEALFDRLTECNKKMNENSASFTRQDKEILRFANYVYFGSY